VTENSRHIARPKCGMEAWTQTWQTNAFIEALNGLFQAAKRDARGYTRFATMRTVLFLIAGKLDSLRRIPIEAGSPCAVAQRRVTHLIFKSGSLSNAAARFASRCWCDVDELASG
jgi:hypothetical protein